MLIALIGESCVGKSTLADALKDALHATVYTGKDYLKLARNEAEARVQFQQTLAGAVTGDETVVYVISEKEQLALLPDGAYRVVVTAELSEIRRRFTERLHGSLPRPVAVMLERKHGMFDDTPCELRYQSGVNQPSELLARLKAK